MKRKTGLGNRKKVNATEEEEHRQEPQPEAVEAVPSETNRESASSDVTTQLISIPFSLITAARNSLLRLIARGTTETTTENTETTAENSQNAEAAQSSMEEQRERAREREISAALTDIPGFPHSTLRSIIIAASNLRDLYGAEEEGTNLPEIDFFFESPSASPTDPTPHPVTSMVFTIIYYIDEGPPRVKTLNKEDLEADIPEVPADGTEGECSICLLQIEKEELLRKLRCLHIFHSECVSEWLTKYSKECPMCRKDAVEEAVEGESK